MILRLDQRRAPYLDAWPAYRKTGIVTYSTPGHNLGRGAPTELVDDILKEIDKHS